MLKIGFIGVGNMASAMAVGLAKARPTWQLFGVDPKPDQLTALQKQCGLEPCQTIESLAKNSDYIVVAVKPQQYDSVLPLLKPFVTEHHVIITIAVGYALTRAQTHLGQQAKIVRSMPNTASLVGAGMSALVANKMVDSTEKDNCEAIFASFGQVVFLNESLFDIFSAISGSLPAYVCIMIEALADAAVRYGLAREQSYAIISQAILGSAQLVRDSNEHPGKLKDQVCSPAGTTAAALSVLEMGGLRGILIEAIEACMQRTKELSHCIKVSIYSRKYTCPKLNSGAAQRLKLFDST